MDKYDTSQLTEFPRFEPESTQSGVSTFLNKLWKLPLFSPSDTAESVQDKALESGKNSGPSTSRNEEQYDDDSNPETGSYAVEYEERSLANVVKRISSLVALGSTGGTRYADTELARYWMPDDISRECYECATRFSALRRRHHCRVCGQIFCSRCCSQRVPGHIFGCAGGLRVCNYCCNIVLSYLRENEMTGDISPDLRTLQENLQVLFPDNKAAMSQRGTFMLARHPEDAPPDHKEGHKEALQDVYRALQARLPEQPHRYRLVRYSGVWRGCDILQFVMDNTSHRTRAQATQVCQSLLHCGYIECVIDMTQFADYALYRAARPAEVEPTEERTRLVESVSSYCLDLNLGENSARLIKSSKPETKTPSDEEAPILQNEGVTESNTLCKAIAESGEDHLKLLFRQCLARQSLNASWLDVLYPLCQQAAEIIVLDVLSHDIDVRNYVQIKKVPGGTARDCCVVPGVVMTKNVAHRGMPQQISNPSILLLDCSIAYQRVEGKLTSLEPLLLQEQEYLVRCAARITALQPKVVLVKGTAARAVQDVLRSQGVALCVGVRDKALQRTARCARADAVTSIDARVHVPKLGTCKNFYVKNFSSKTLIVLEGCAAQNLGCCILLRGASLAELIRIKKVVKFMLLACYNWKLEKAFLRDIEAVLPEPGMTFDDDEIIDNKDDITLGDNQQVVKDISIKDSESLFNDKSKTENKNLDHNKTDDKKVNETKNKESLSSDSNDNESLFSDTRKRETTETRHDSSNKHSNESSSNTKSLEKDSETLNKPLITSVEDSEDPLTAKFVRKTDSDKTLSVPIRDFSDPLRSNISVDDDVFLPKDDAIFKADSHSDRWSTDDVVLSISPNIIIPVPYLETDAGRRSNLRRLFPTPLLPQRPPHTPKITHRSYSMVSNKDTAVEKELHPFIKEPMTAPVDDISVRTALANFRATGGRWSNSEHAPSCPQYKISVVKKVPKASDTKEKQPENAPLDPMDPENHQQSSFLLYSYSNKSANVPDFCVNPWIVTMDKYGRHDISLGAFLEKYCFNSENKCPSSNCQVPMNQHVRKFVHEDVCITITCNTIGHSNVDKVKEEQNKQVMFWSRCEQCSTIGSARRLSSTALSISLAQYLSIATSGSRLSRSSCKHPLHSLAHAFVSQLHLTTAGFRFTKIMTYDLEFPPEIITTHYDTKQMRDALIAQLNDLMLKGHETYSSIQDSEAEKDYNAFKQHTEQIHLSITSANLQEHTSLPALVKSLWTLSDRIITGEKMLREAQERWSAPIVKPSKVQPDTSSVEEKSDVEDSTGDSTESSDSSGKEIEKEQIGIEEDEEKGDKKTVRQILSQLLSNNQPSNQGGMIITSGLVAVSVMAGEIGSVIAAALASHTYQRTLHKNQSENEDIELSINKDRTDGDKTKAAKSNDHIEVLLKDGLVCRIYYAAQFHKLRHYLLAPLGMNPHISDEFIKAQEKVESDTKCCEEGKESKNLCEIEEGFVRSLAHSIPWAARGGKSGSTFCKTKDDRYVLKEMTKPEWQQFLAEFAPHYFNYVINCHQHRVPSLLARIVGVYSVGGAGNGVLVMENVFYRCGQNATFFDLKGSSRHRLANDAVPRALLMDENLLHLRWKQPLYVSSPAAQVLFRCVDRDTQFLADNSVMDYSLLLALYDNKLRLGIIDYIRTFTWDKKLEHIVKKNLGSGLPTVVSPATYRSRFATAARKYFLHCPHHWAPLTQPHTLNTWLSPLSTTDSHTDILTPTGRH